MEEEKIYKVKCVNCEKEFDISIKHVEELMSSSRDGEVVCASVAHEFMKTCPICRHQNRVISKKTYDEQGKPIYEVSSLKNEKTTSR